MEIRALRETEIDQAWEHVCLAFGKPGHPRFKYHMTDDSSFELEQVRVCVVDGRIVSHVRVSDRPIHIGPAVVRMGGIGAVSTHPEHRGRGYSLALLWDTIRYMERAEYDLSMLFTGIPRHYARAGWVTFPEHRFSVAVGEPPPLDSPYSVRDFDEARDLDAVINIYNHYNAARTGAMARPRRYWLDRHTRALGVLPSWVAERDGKVVAYLRGSSTYLGEVAYPPDHREAVAPICARAMREAKDIPPSEHMARPARSRHPDAPRIGGELTKSHPALDLLAQWSPGGVHHEETEGMMLRVIRLAPLLQKVAPVLEDRLARSGLMPRTKSITVCEQGQTATIVIDGSHLHVEAGEGGDMTLEPGGRCFFKLLLGDSTFTQLRELIPGAEETGGEDAALLDLLFPSQEPVYYGCDHF